MAHAFKKSAALRIASVGALADAVGAAYGLTGTHKDWAVASEADLNARVTAAMPTLMTQVQAPRAANAADSFFGESDSLETMGDPFAAGAPVVAPAPMPMNPGYGAGDALPQSIAGLPKSSNNTMLLLLVGGGALVVGIILVLLFVLLR